MRVSVNDNGQMRRLMNDLGRAAAGIERKVDRVVEKGALNIKNDLEEQIGRSSPYPEGFRGMKGSVTYDRKRAIGRLGAEIGPDKSRRGGALGNLFFFGGANGGGGTGDLDGAMARELPRFAKAMGDLLGGVL